MKLIAQGAESKLYLKKNIVVKDRFKKKYRIKEIDDKLRTFRTKRESKVLQKLQVLKFPSPKLIKIKDEIIELEYSKIKFGPLNIETAKTLHTNESIAYRISDQNGKSITYSGDTDFCEPIIALAQDTDILVIECSFPTAMKVAGHLTPAEVGKIAQECKCKHVILTHIYPVHEIDPTNELNDVFDGKVTLGKDLMTFKI